MTNKVETELAALREADEELVYYTAPVDPTRQKTDITVAVNGELIKIQRGKRVKIKRKFLKVLEDAEKQTFAAMEYQVKAQEDSKKPLANL